MMELNEEQRRNPDIEQIIRSSLDATASWGWSDEDRRWSAAGAAQKYLGANSTMSQELAQGVALKIVDEIMKELLEDTVTLVECPYCRAHHQKYLVDLCPLNPYKVR